MTSCQLSSLVNYTFSTAMTVGVFGLAALVIVLAIRVLLDRGGKSEMQLTG